MKRLLLIIILTFSLQSLTNADDIKDFEIEGISLGDSLLDHFSEKEIKKFGIEHYPDKEFSVLSVLSNRFKNYDAMQFDIKKNDKTYYLHGVIGIILYENNLKDCYIKMDEIIKSLSLVLVDYYKEDVGRLANPVAADPYGGTYDLFLFKKNQSNKSDRVQVSCNDWSKKSNIPDSVKVEIYSKEFAYYVDYIAFN